MSFNQIGLKLNVLLLSRIGAVLFLIKSIVKSSKCFCAQEGILMKITVKNSYEEYWTNDLKITKRILVFCTLLQKFDHCKWILEDFRQVSRKNVFVCLRPVPHVANI